jgi:hypothetical protein
MRGHPAHPPDGGHARLDPTEAGERIVSQSWAMPDSTDPIKQPICCPICGVPLDEIVLARPDEEYFCPGCCTQQKPGAASAEFAR